MDLGSMKDQRIPMELLKTFQTKWSPQTCELYDFVGLYLPFIDSQDPWIRLTYENELCELIKSPNLQVIANCQSFAIFKLFNPNQVKDFEERVGCKLNPVVQVVTTNSQLKRDTPEDPDSEEES